ncbi:hypothetical protein F0562_031180 [Nyssa sinensis]|uniref:UDP-glycosyltransferases domain-containing protein n=1 Tax=Nyssa sinensis TaxID=561372 RepID=A0A5J5ARN7_9ASTE|nr:hypothetical protein F0562_031180 [Nyssa sinensis]
MEDTIVLYPSPAVGHLISMVELGKLILTDHPFFSIKILITAPPYNAGSTAPYINSVSTTTPITFHHLPSVSLPLHSSSPHQEALAFEFLRLNNPNVHQALLSISQNSNIHAFIMDFFCTPALTVAADFKIPAYFFMTSGAGCLSSMLYFPTIHRTTTKSLKDLDTYIENPGIPPMMVADMPKTVHDRTDKAYECLLNISIQLPKSAGIIVNTFEALEARTIKAISDGLCVPDEPTPPVYCIGPLIAANDQTGGGECLTWLDSQPSQSVVFLCFGSLGLFSSEQLMEIAVGLERSGQRFLWVVRSPATEDKSRRFLAPPEPDLDALLPDGFLERTKDRGLVVKSWAPQVAVLNHDSVGGFVTHCGWNSVLEAVCAGVPMVAWPLYAEQRLNRVLLVEEMKLALPMKESEDGFVKAGEVEKRVKELMDSEEGNSVRKRTLSMKDAANAAMSCKSGSTRIALAKLVESWTLQGIGHLVSMVELGKLILNHHPSFSVIILTTSPPFNTGSTAPYIRSVSATTPAINFYPLPTISLPLDIESYPSIDAINFEILLLNNPHVHHALQSISLTSTIAAFIIDFFCTPALSIAADLKIPAHYFFTSGAGCLASFLYLPTIHRNTDKSFKDLNTLLDIPSLPPIPSSDMPKPMLDRTFTEYSILLDYTIQLPKSAGIIVNTFKSLEPKAVKGISDGLCVPDGPTPPVFCIGPLIAADERRSGGSVHECLKWLDSQPRRSVVFLCFGSLGTFSAEQLKEIAVGLERSGQRFMWVVRTPPSQDKSRRFLAPPDPDLDALLPDGFLNRTKERGLVVKSWAPQVTVLSHDSVGGFVTHCGWNSVLEAACAGVPMVAWPLYAEQRFNRVLLVEEMKLALPINESEDGFVSAAEVEKRVRELMESEEGKLVRERAHAEREAARAAMTEGVSSRVELAKLVESWKLG